MSDDPFFVLRTRAYDLADSGRYKGWDQIATALKAEHFLPSLINRLGQDGQAVMMIARCCVLARG